MWTVPVAVLGLHVVLPLGCSDPPTDLTYAWSVDTPPAGVAVEFDPIDPIAANDPTPTVTITKDPGDAVTVTLTLAVNNVGRLKPPVEDTITIDVYDDACKAAIGKLAADYSADFDGNCLIDFDDFVLMATKWLNDTGLTEPVVK